jgi:hypothetical protein
LIQVSCPKHRRYKAIRQPVTDCYSCWFVWFIRHEVDKQVLVVK